MTKTVTPRILIAAVVFIISFSAQYLVVDAQWGGPRWFYVPTAANGDSSTFDQGTGDGSTFDPGAAQTATPAQSSDLPLSIRIENPLKVKTVGEAINLFMEAVVKVAIPFIVIFFIWSGLQFILAQGNPEKLKKAKNMFWYTIIGTLLILGAWAITDAIIGTVNSISN